ncbi:MAG: TPM domain-containing protein [Pseudomonadota bacterium]
MKRLADEDTRRAIADAIEVIEQQTRAEVVAVLAPASATYGEYALLWSAGIALLSTTLAPYAMPPITPLIAPLIAPMHLLPLIGPTLFLVLMLAFRQPVVLRHLVPRQVLRQHAAAMARVQFLTQQLHHTREETGLLLFVSEFEHYVEILADRGIARQVPDQAWQELVATFTQHLAKKEIRDGFVETITGCGRLLAERLPADNHNPNELPNRLVVLP